MTASPKSRRSAPAKSAGPRKVAEVTVDARVIELRSYPRSFAYIAKELGLEHSRDAFAAFVTAVTTRPKSEQVSLRTEENGRLDDLERRTRRLCEPDQLDRKLAAIARLRERLMAGAA
ncbi:MAG: hypothetical protein QOC92_4755 [Acidimicrobiaceae bacterium]